MIGGVLATPSLRGGPHAGPPFPSGDEQWKWKSALVASVYSGLLWTRQRANMMGETRKMRDTAAECVWERGERLGLHTRRLHGEKRPQCKRETPSLVKRWKDHHQRERAITTKDSQKPAYSVLLIFALPILARKLVGTAILRRTTESDFPLENCTFRPVRSGFTCD
jgi:hypothetical protein